MKLKQIVFAIILLHITFAFSVFASDADSSLTDTIQKKEETIFVSVEQMPEIPGGKEELFKFISNNLKYPDMVGDFEGRVIVQFVVEKDGSISDIKVIRSLHPEYDKEAMRVIKLMPKWLPGNQRGKAVRVSYILPIVFKLQK